MEQENKALVTRIENLESQIRELTQARNNQAKLAGERQEQIQGLVQDREARRKELQEVRQAKKRLVQEKQQLLSQVSRLKTELEQIATQRERADNRVRQEFLKYEAQIDLIKELLLQKAENAGQG